MSASEKGGDNRGDKRGDNRGSRRRPFRRKEREHSQEMSRSGKKVPEAAVAAAAKGDKYEKKRGGFVERLRWIPPETPTEPLPAADCPWCGKPIKDMSSAITETGSGNPVHFDCVLARLCAGETLEKGDSLSYIGGGRFAIVHFGHAPGSRKFSIKKIFEWENKEHRSEWRKSICSHFSVT